MYFVVLFLSFHSRTPGIKLGSKGLGDKDLYSVSYLTSLCSLYFLTQGFSLILDLTDLPGWAVHSPFLQNLPVSTPQDYGQACAPVPGSFMGAVVLNSCLHTSELLPHSHLSSLPPLAVFK